jgi:hypothetical protein
MLGWVERGGLHPHYLYRFIWQYLGAVVTSPAQLIPTHEKRQVYCKCWVLENVTWLQLRSFFDGKPVASWMLVHTENRFSVSCSVKGVHSAAFSYDMMLPYAELVNIRWWVRRRRNNYQKRPWIHPFCSFRAHSSTTQGQMSDLG